LWPWSTKHTNSWYGQSTFSNGNLQVTVSADGTSISLFNIETSTSYFTATFSLSPSINFTSYLSVTLNTTAGNKQERIFGLGQGGWTADCEGCPTLPPSTQIKVPLQRNGQWVSLRQSKFHVAIPFVYSSSGYGLLYHMPGYGNVSVGEFGVGGMNWSSVAALGLDFWITGLPSGVNPTSAAPIYTQYADATGHAPLLREDAMIFWQSRNRYKSSAITEAIASNYSSLGLPVGVLVVDYENQIHDGDFNPNPNCYPSLVESIHVYPKDNKRNNYVLFLA
jgi:alpha-glucosidase (family GH31 glycosyl hydrolase)